MKSQVSAALVALAAIATALTATDARAVTIVEVFTEAQAGAPVGLTFLETVAVDGGVAYAALRDTSAAVVGGVVAFDGSTFTAVMTPADWTTFGSTNDYAAGNGAAVVGGVLRAISFFDNNVLEVDLGTGVVTEVVSTADLQTVVSSPTANYSAVFEVTSDGTIYAVESDTDQLVAISAGNVASIEINAADFAAALGGTSIGGIGVAGDILYLGSNSSDTLVAWNTATNMASTVLTTAEIEAVTDDIDGSVGFGDILAGPDGLVYFYESDADYLLAFDPSDPVGSLKAVVTEADFDAGPSSDTINQLAFWNGSIAFTDTGEGFYSVVPEPASLLLTMCLVSGAALRRRRAA